MKQWGRKARAVELCPRLARRGVRCKRGAAGNEDPGSGAAGKGRRTRSVPRVFHGIILHVAAKTDKCTTTYRPRHKPFGEASTGPAPLSGAARFFRKKPGVTPGTCLNGSRWSNPRRTDTPIRPGIRRHRKHSTRAFHPRSIPCPGHATQRKWPFKEFCQGGGTSLAMADHPPWLMRPPVSRTMPLINMKTEVQPGSVACTIRCRPA